jgi:Putative auto-transporter adhesin, head GIN domain
MNLAPTQVAAPHARRPVQLVLTSLLVLLLAAILTALLVDRTGSGRTFVGSGVAATQTRSLPSFGSVEVAGIANLSVHVGGPQSVVISADDNLLSRITTTVHSGRLVIGTKPGSYSTKTPIGAQVTVPSVSALALEGSGEITASGLSGKAMTLTLAGEGSIRASGTVTLLHITLSGAGQAQLSDLKAHDATALISGEGQIELTATNRLDAIVTGSGSIRYLGNPPHITTSVTGAGAITRG